MIGYNLYDKRLFWRSLLLLLAMAGAMKVSGGYAAAILPLLAVGALISSKPTSLLYTVVMMVVLTISNNQIVTKNFIFGICVRSTLCVLSAIMMIRVAGRRSSPFISPLSGILLYIAWECVSSAMGWDPMISYLKLILFTFIFLAFYGSANSAICALHANAAAMRSIMLCFASYMIIGSFVLVFFPGIGLMNIGDFASPADIPEGALSLFKGITMHSQSLGPIVSAFATILFADLIFSIRRWHPFYVVMLLLSPYLIYRTSSRTAAGALFAGLGMAMWLFMRAYGIGQRWKGRIVSLMTLLVMLSGVAVLVLPSARHKALTFVVKFHNVESNEKVTLDEVVSTRRGNVEAAMHNFKEKPLTGNGFQVSEDMKYMRRRSMMQYLSAPVEKGVWVSAVLEEGGGIGFALFSGFLIVAFSTLVKRRAYISVSTMFVMVVSNMGEFTMFSMTYTGGLIWALVFCAGVMDACREKERIEEALMMNPVMVMR